MSLLYKLEGSFLGKAIQTAVGCTLNPIVTGSLLAFLEKAPKETIQNLLQHASLPPDYDLAKVKMVLMALAAVGALRAANNKLSSMAVNNWRLGGAPGWDWPKEIAVVTGGSSGIGLAIVKKLLTKGIKVAVFDIQPLPKELQNKPSVRYYKCDVTSTKSIAEAGAGVRRDLGEPTIFVNNAGIAVPKAILDIEEKALQKIFSINTMSHWYTVQEFLPSMVKANKGHFVNVASVASFVSLPGHADYGATKASALAFHEALQVELKAIYDAPNVLTTIVHPNFVSTPLLDDFKSHLDSSGVTYITADQVADATAENIFGRKSGQVIVPKSSGVAASLRGAPWWLQSLVHGFLGANAKSLSGR